MAEIVLDGVWKIYPGDTVAVQELSMDIADGEFIVLVGPSGCGKTTALRMIAGLETITRGVVQIGERIVNDVPPKERDIAMVFQNYALYPHMTVFDNMAFGLKLQGVAKAEIAERVHEAGRILGLEELLDRKPKALSGGQRQRVAMGRAIVRKPQAFLMDEPLSNLDAKLRVQMRAEIARIQRDLGVTTFYVTHDQTEAMTMGDRVAVIRKGQLQQIDQPQRLYDEPANLFVAGFIGSPAMNMYEARLESRDGGLGVVIGSQRLPVPDQLLAERPGLGAFLDRDLIVGIRPEDMEDASLVRDAPADRRIRTTVELREALGSEVVLHGTLDAPAPVTDDTKELATDVGAEVAERAERHAGVRSAPLIAKLNPRTSALKGQTIELVVDTTRLHFFDPSDSTAVGRTEAAATT